VSTDLNHSELCYQSFLEDQIILIVPPDHAWVGRGPVAPADLLGQPFILRESTAGSHEVLAEGLARQGVDVERLQAVLLLANAEAIEMSVEAGIGAAFVSRLAASRSLSLGKVVEVPVSGLDLRRSIFMVRHQRHVITPLQQAFWEFAFAPENDPVRRIAEYA
jgi:DNA-binding transcriptional LysR family regulator